MSQEKVNRYKEEKARRKEKLRKERFKSMVRKLVVLVLSLALVGWVVFSAVDTYQANRPRDTVTVNYEGVTNYLQALQDEIAAMDADVEVETEAEEEAEAEVNGEDGEEVEDNEEEEDEEE